MPGSRSREAPRGDDGDEVLQLRESPLWRMAGTVAVTAGSLIALAQLGQLATYDRADVVASLTDPFFRAFSIAYAAAFVALMLALVALYMRQAGAGGTFGLLGFGAAVLGTMCLGANMWFEAFCSPWLLEAAPTLLTAEKAVIWQIGYLSSYATFALGWMLFGISCLRARVYPTVACLAVVLGGAIGFFAAQPPFGVPLGLAVAALGAWLWRSDRAASAASAVPQPAQPGAGVPERR